MTRKTINTMTFTLAKEVGRTRVTVNSVMPGILDTDSTAAWLHTEERQKNAKKMSALRREGQPEEVATAVSFLVSEKASFWTNC